MKDKLIIGKHFREVIIVGFALFAMFFGAGNLIFPPALGSVSGKDWFTAFFGFFAMDALLALLGVFTMVSYGGDISLVGGRLGKRISALLPVIIVLCIGPCVAIPRTATVSFSMGLEPILGSEGNNGIALAIFSVVFFVIVYALSVHPSGVVDIIGKYLTPVLLIFLLLLIAVGIINGKCEEASSIADSPIKLGVFNGYQTMDGMAALIFSGIMIESTGNDEAANRTRNKRIIIPASCVAAILLFIVYGGLTYLGRLWGLPYGSAFLNGEIDQAKLLMVIVEQIMGKVGVYVLGVVTVFACLTTAIGLVASSAEFFCGLLHDKISYKFLCLMICLCGMGLSNVGLQTIIYLASPILLLVYPPVIVLIVLGIFQKRIHGNSPFILGAGVAFAVSLMELLCDTVELQTFSFVHALPLSQYGLGFLLPSTIGVILGLLITKAK